MLNFFRKYQKFFFIFTSIAIIFSFTFFGTFQAFVPSKSENDSVVGHTVHGKKIRSRYLTQMGYFLSNEATPGFHSKELPLGNFFNDGVITKEFLETGMAKILIEHYADEFKNDLQSRLDKEKNFVPYSHPNASDLSAESAWKFFAPEIQDHLAALQKCEKGNELSSFEKRVNLFLAERRFPPAFLAQVLRYQQRDYPNIPADPKLMREDFSLFGYHDLQDWFGPHFVECTAQVIINCAQIARKQGYRASREEILSELLYRSEKTFSALKAQVSLPVDNSGQFFQVALRHLGMDESTLVSIWEDITLFRRLFHDIGSGVMVDSLPMDNFHEFVNQYATIELTQMPDYLKFNTKDALRQFETYLSAVSADREDPLSLPLKPDSLEIIEERAPELVGKHMRFYAGHLLKGDLQSKVSVKETWDWELQPDNWKSITERFAELASKTGKPFEILESLDPKMRTRIDAFARSQIVQAHPEWIGETLKEISMEEKTYFATKEPTKKILPGISNIQAFIEILEKREELFGYTQDEKNYYRILPMDAGGKELLTFQQALQEGVLSSLEEKLNGEEQLEKWFAAAKKEFGNHDENELISYRFFNHLKNYKEDDESENSFFSQFNPVTMDKTVSRLEPLFIPFEKVLVLETDQKSEYLVDPKEGTYCFTLLERKIDTTPSQEKMIEAQEILSQEIQCHYLKEILSLIEQKKAIVFTDA